MTSMPASRRARAMILAPRSWPSRPGLAIRTRIFFSGISLCSLCSYLCALCVPISVLSVFLSLCSLCYGSILDDIPADAFFENRNIEINQQTDAVVGKAKIREDRGLVNECNGFDGLQLDNNRIFHKQVEAETTF